MILYIMNIKSVISKEVHFGIFKNLCIVLFFGFMIYICIKTVQTQQKKKLEGFIQRRKNKKTNNVNTNKDNTDQYTTSITTDNNNK